ncbi:peptidase [Sphingomonas tabacisoli]|uniref:Peptidase n=1 Tax=Sphingomonas tabacisoli TaxID=2249466 RepID=A0ABW4HZG0_9SPHN
MTYCLGMLLESGLVLMADTRTNAGVDNFSTFRKLHVLADGPDRQIYAATAGSLSVSQTVIGTLREDQLASDSGEPKPCLGEAPTMFRVAQLVGEAVEHAGASVGAALDRAHIESHVDVLVGGRVGDGPLKLFEVYSVGNFIECTQDVPFLQIGETKYGRPILDRTLRYDTPLADAVKLGCLSFDATMKSNLGVAQPIDVLVIPADRALAPISHRIERHDPYFVELQERWQQGLRKTAASLPTPRWMK